MSVGRIIGSLIERYASRNERIQKLLDLPEWTPAMGALIVFGLEPPLDCIDIPDKAIDFEGRTVTDNSSFALFEARKLLAQWEDWQEDTCFIGFAMSPFQFIDWCIHEGVENHWFSLVRSLTNCSEAGYFEALPSPLDIPLPAKLAIMQSATAQSLPNAGTATAASPSAPNTENSKPVNSNPGWHAYIGDDQSLHTHLLTTSSLAAAFEGVGLWPKERWNKNLPVQRWTHGARRIHGKTRKDSYWDPVAFAILAHFKRKIEINALTKAFDRKEILWPWLPKWRNFVSDLDEWA